MNKYAALIMFSLLSAGCSNWSGKPNPSIVDRNADNQLIVRAGLFDSCDHFDNATAGQESALAATLASAAIMKAAEWGADAFASAVAAAAKKRNEAFSVDGNNPDWLYKKGKNPAQIRRCLVVVAGAQVAEPEPCKQKDSNWRKQFVKDNCSVSPIVTSMQSWGIDKPALYAEIVLYSPERTAPYYVLPKVVYAYYPQPLSSHAAKDLKNTLVTIKASSPGENGKKFEVVFKDGEFAPGKEIQVAPSAKALAATRDSGKWLVIPGDLPPSPKDGNGGAVDIAASIIETPTPNKLLAFANEIVQENKPALTTALNEELSYAFLADTRQKQRTAEVEAGETTDASTLAACKALESSVQTAVASRLKADASPGSDALSLDYKDTCLRATINLRKATALWRNSSYNNGGVLCFSERIANNLSATCR